MILPKPVVLSEEGGCLVCDVAAVSGHDGFRKLLIYLERFWSAELITRADGPDACRYVLQVHNVTIFLEYEDPWGNRIVAASPLANDVINKIASDFQTRFVEF